MESRSTELYVISNVSFDMSLCGIEQNENDAAIISSLLFLMDSNVDQNATNCRSHSQADIPIDEEYVGHSLKYAQCGNVSIQDFFGNMEVKSTTTNDFHIESSKTRNHLVLADTSLTADSREDLSLIQKKGLHLLVSEVNSTGANELGFVHHMANNCSIPNGLKRSIQNLSGTAH